MNPLTHICPSWVENTNQWFQRAIVSVKPGNCTANAHRCRGMQLIEICTLQYTLFSSGNTHAAASLVCSRSDPKAGGERGDLQCHVSNRLAFGFALAAMFEGLRAMLVKPRSCTVCAHLFVRACVCVCVSHSVSKSFFHSNVFEQGAWQLFP